MTNLTFGKGESQTANHFLSFVSHMSTTLFIDLFYSLLLIQKELKLQQLAKAKSKSDYFDFSGLGNIVFDIFN